MPLEPAAEIRAADRYFSTHEVGEILGVNPSSIVKWINDGRLDAFRTPGGHRRISAAQLVRFAQHSGMPVPESLRELGARTVLAIDEGPQLLAALQQAFDLHPNELDLRTSQNGIEGLMLVGALKPDFLILDLGLKSVDGFEALERVRANPDTQHTVVIALGARLDEARAAKCKKLGAALCLQKPVDAEGLVATLRSLRKLARRA